MSDPVLPQHETDIRALVRERYGSIAQNAKGNLGIDCGCSPSQSSCCASSGDLVQLDMVSNLYQDPEVATLPSEVTGLSLGCGDPVTLASLQPGQTVLDLGSGGGIDCFLAARKVGPTGQVIGVDMTAAMIEKARANQAKVGAQNVEFRLGEIEHLPVADNTVDVIISNCVINLSPDKPQVFHEAFRVLKSGGRLAVSDIVTDSPLPDAIKNSLSAWAGCIAGALDVKEYIAAIEQAGFVDVEVKPSYWSQETIEAALDSLDPKTDLKVAEAEKQDKTVVGISNGNGGEVIQIDKPLGLSSFDPQKAIFSAKITARKPWK